MSQLTHRFQESDIDWKQKKSDFIFGFAIRTKDYLMMGFGFEPDDGLENMRHNLAVLYKEAKQELIRRGIKYEEY